MRKETRYICTHCQCAFADMARAKKCEANKPLPSYHKDQAVKVDAVRMNIGSKWVPAIIVDVEIAEETHRITYCVKPKSSQCSYQGVAPDKICPIKPD